MVRSRGPCAFAFPSSILTRPAVDPPDDLHLQRECDRHASRPCRARPRHTCACFPRPTRHLSLLPFLPGPCRRPLPLCHPLRTTPPPSPHRPPSHIPRPCSPYHTIPPVHLHLVAPIHTRPHQGTHDRNVVSRRRLGHSLYVGRVDTHWRLLGGHRMARQRHALHPVRPCFPFRTLSLLFISHFRIPHPSPQLLLTPLLAFASSSKSDEFAHASYLCAICLSQRKGVHCLALSCGHVFCRSCLVDMWGLHIKEGQVSHVGCPEPNCGKPDADGLREATEDEVRAVLSESELNRWKWLRRKRDLERDPTMIHCPMEYCQEPVPKPKSDIPDSDQDEFSWGRLRTCPACDYAFCALCRRTW